MQTLVKLIMLKESSKMKFKKAFTMLELIIVIVIMGIVSKFGVEFLVQAYRSYLHSSVNNQLMNESETAIEFVANRLQYRIKDSIIVRQDDDNKSNYTALSNADTSQEYISLEWVESDIDSFKGSWNGSIFKPNYSAIIDLDDSNKSTLISPETNTTAINSYIDTLSEGNSNFEDSAIYFISGDSDIDGYGWDGVKIDDQNHTMHPIKHSDSNISYFEDDTSAGDFSGVDVYEYYQISWSANAFALKDGNLTFYYDYQPWEGEYYKDDAKKVVVMQNVDTFRFIAIGSVVKIQLCVHSDLIESEAYSICKEKTIF